MSASRARCDVSILTVHQVQGHLAHVVKHSNRSYLLHLMMIQNPSSLAKTNLKFFYIVRPNVFDAKEITIASTPVKTKKNRRKVTLSLSFGLNHISRKRKHVLLLLSLRTEVKQGPIVFIGFGICPQRN